jgi:SNF2 family DNA or RNA helicase
MSLGSYEEYDWPAHPDIRDTAPMVSQKTTVEFLLSNKRAFCLNDMGTGKTLSALWAFDILRRMGKVRRMLVIGPLTSLRSVWANEMFRNIPDISWGIAHGTREHRLRIINSHAEVVIINHDGVVTMFEALLRAQFDIIVIDELTAFKTWNANRTKHMTLLAHNVKAVWGLTGDATPNSPLEAYSQAKLVNPQNKNLPKYFTTYRDMTMTRLSEYMYVPKPEAPNIVASVLQPAIRFTREQCVDLPPTTYTTQEVELSAEQKQIYEKVKKELYAEHAKGIITAANAAVALNKLLQISAGAVKGTDGTPIYLDNQPRLTALLNIFEQTPQKKLVIFATFRATIDHLVRFLNEKEIRTADIHGDVTQNQRAQRIEEFQRGDLNCLVMQPQSSAHSITLVAASTVLWFSMIPSNELYGQGIARVVRTGQKRNTLVIRFVASKAEEHIAKLLDRKGALSAEILGLFEHHDL